MAVKKRANGLIDNFISRGAEVKSIRNKSFTNVLVRIPDSILNELDEILEDKPWLNRTQWIVGAINDKIQKENI